MCNNNNSDRKRRKYKSSFSTAYYASPFGWHDIWHNKPPSLSYLGNPNICGTRFRFYTLSWLIRHNEIRTGTLEILYFVLKIFLTHNDSFAVALILTFRLFHSLSIYFCTILAKLLITAPNHSHCGHSLGSRNSTHYRTLRTLCDSLRNLKN